MRVAIVVGIVMVALAAGSVRAEAQLGRLISPGPLAKAHGNLEGVSNCQRCHAQGRRVTAAKCLACHKPVADRILRKTGVHANVKGDCVSCHVEHAGGEGELRPFDQKTFDHARVTGFPLDGRHELLTSNCAACHKTRSFLNVSTGCVSCHVDSHKGTLGRACAKCHTTTLAFKESRTGFDHSRTAFPLTGAHRTVKCASCHAGRIYKVPQFESCATCHKNPHRPPVGTACATCHTTDTWQTRRVDHSKTAYPLNGLHAKVECVKCHVQRPMRAKPASDRCAVCHTDPHRGAFKQDCKGCHTETGFAKAPFDHSKTKFPLADKHAAATCTACHTNVVTAGVPLARRVADFTGLSVACVSCHEDVHVGDLGTTCETCHQTAKTFTVTAFTHPRYPELYAGEHTPLKCEQCHKPSAVTKPVRTSTRPPIAKFKGTATECVSCHADIHIGQVAKTCQDCHSVSGAKFAVVGFSHDKTKFPLKGLHQPVECTVCHKKETARFPSGMGTARRLTGIATTCVSCHNDVHRGELGVKCEACHTESVKAFKIARYVHQSKVLNRDFFGGGHAGVACVSCHKPATGRTPVGAVRTVSYKIKTTCTSCHLDVHRGSLGPNCADCHRLRS